MIKSNQVRQKRVRVFKPAEDPRKPRTAHTHTPCIIDKENTKNIEEHKMKKLYLQHDKQLTKKRETEKERVTTCC